MLDLHIDVAKSPDDERSDCIVAEVTPRLRAKHTAWTVQALNKLAKDRTLVRMSGWLLLDQFHEDFVERGIRGTIWEIHPVMQIEVRQGNEWVKLDDL
jgi:hypothetical protein